MIIELKIYDKLTRPDEALENETRRSLLNLAIIGQATLISKKTYSRHPEPHTFYKLEIDKETELLYTMRIPDWELYIWSN